MTYYDIYKADPSAFIPTIIISLIITLVAYGTFPLIYAKFRREPITEKKYKRRCYGINAIAMVFFFLLADKPSASAYLLWTFVFSSSGVRRLTKRGMIVDEDSLLSDNSEKASSAPEVQVGESTNDDTGSQQLAEQKPVGTKRNPKQRFCKLCGGAIDPDIKKCTKCGKQYFRLRITRTVAFVAIIAVLCTAFGFMSKYRADQHQIQLSQLNSKISELESTLESRDKTIEQNNQTIEQYKQQISDKNQRNHELIQKKLELEQKVRFFDMYVVFVLDDNTYRYHKYDCTVFQRSFDSFWAYNVEAAESRGYTACYVCN